MKNKNNLREVTPKSMQCGIGACPQIHEGDTDYLIVGEQVNPSNVGLKGRVGKGEVLIRVSKNLIDKKEK